MDLQLVVISGPDKGKIFPIHTGPDLMLGKCHSAYYQLHDTQVARNHCQVLRQEDKVTIIDNATGTLYINGLKMTNRALIDGDVIKIGDTQLRFHVGPLEEPDVPDDDIEVVDEADIVEEVEIVEDLEALSGQPLAHFQLGPVLGTGRTGAVFQARDLKTGQSVALKVLREVYGQHDEAVKSFVRTMKILLPLRHAHLVPVLAAGKTGHHCWVATDAVEAMPLSQLIEQVRAEGKPDWHCAFKVAVQGAKALDYINRQGLVHGHLTPGNILRDRKGARIADLMMTRALDEALAEPEDPEAEPLPDMGYWSPERTRGWKEVSPSCDLYGLGATLYGLLTGRPPFAAKNQEMLTARIRDMSPEKPTKYQKATPVWFERIVLRLLAKRAKDRFASAEELIMELEDASRMAGMTG